MKNETVEKVVEDDSCSIDDTNKDDSCGISDVKPVGELPKQPDGLVHEEVGYHGDVGHVYQSVGSQKVDQKPNSEAQKKVTFEARGGGSGFGCDTAPTQPKLKFSDVENSFVRPAGESACSESLQCEECVHCVQCVHTVRDETDSVYSRQ